MKKRSSGRDREGFSGSTIELRKGRGRPIKRRMFYLKDETGRVLFEIYGSGLAFTERPHSKIKSDRFLNVVSIPHLQVSFDKHTTLPAIAIFQGLHPVRRILNHYELKELIKGLVKAYLEMGKEWKKTKLYNGLTGKAMGEIMKDKGSDEYEGLS